MSAQIRLFLSDLFNFTYGNIISDDEINKRIGFITDHFETLQPLSIFKTILYSDTKNELGKLALDFRMKFISKNYENVIRSGESYEIDNLEDSFGNELRSKIYEECLVINHFLLKIDLLNSKEEIISHINEFFTFFEKEPIKLTGLTLEVIGNIGMWMTLNERCYSGVYGINFVTMEKLPIENITSIKRINESRFKLFSKLKDIYKKPFEQSIVLNVNFFG